MTAPVEKLLDGNQESKIIAMRLAEPPAGYGKWTLRLLARKVVELEIVDAVSYETIRRTLKKNRMNANRHTQYWVIPPEADAEFTAHMEDILDVYSRPYNADVNPWPLGVRLTCGNKRRKLTGQRKWAS